MPERYEFIRKVAQGGFGRVYVARDTRLGREVAIKRLLSAEESSGFQQAEATFQREATTLAAMQHPNIVQVFDFDRDEEGTFVVMEMLEGETLKERLDRGPLTWDTFVSVARQALDAINAAHSQGIMHRDLKPENLFLHKTPSGSRVLKVLDFGLAKLSNVPSKQTMDQSGNVFGSIYYMAPEQFMREPLDGRTDLYALGCVFYQALTARFPYHGDNMQATMEAHMKHDVKHVRERRPDMSPTVADWVMRLISFKPTDRPADAMTAMREFDAALKGEAPAVKAEPVPAPAAVPSTVSRPVAPPPQSVRAPSTPAPAAAKTTSSVPGSGLMKTPMQTRAMSALEASRLEARAKMEAAAKRKRLAVMVGAPVVVTGLLLYVFLNPASDAQSTKPSTSSGSKPPAQTSGKAPAPADLLPSAAPLTLPLEDAIAWRFRGAEELWNNGRDGKQTPTRITTRSGSLHEWRNVAPQPRDLKMTLYGGKLQRAASTHKAEINGPGTEHAYVFISSAAGLDSRLEGQNAPLAPGSTGSTPKGVTVATVLRANGSSKLPSMRPIILTGSGGGSDSFSVHFSHRVGQYWAMVQRQGQLSQALVRPQQFEKSGAGGNWVALVTTWDADAALLDIKVRSPDGTVAQAASAAVPEKGMPVLDRLNIGDFHLHKASKLKPDEKMDGDIAEITVYRRALDAATQDKLLNAMWDRYFKKR